MNAQVTFETEFFLPKPGEDEKTNPGCFGQALAEWLSDQLKARGVEVAEVLPEDFGWIVVVSRKPFLLWLACANIDESVTEWSVFPVAERSLIQRLFGRIDPKSALEELWRHIRELIPAIPGVRKIVWEA